MLLNSLATLLLLSTTPFAFALTRQPKVLRRHRRFVFPSDSGWSASFGSTLSIPIEGASSSLSFSVPFSYSFDTGVASGRKRRRRRSVHADHEGERQGALRQVEELLSLATGMDGHACLLRVICEASHTPSHKDGLIGDAINALLLPPHVLDILPPKEKGESEYVGAQRAGRGAKGDCSEYHLGCPTSFFQVIDDPLELCSSTSSSMNDTIATTSETDELSGPNGISMLSTVSNTQH